MGHPDSPNANHLYLVDLGLSQRYTAPNGEHLPYRQIPTDFRWVPLSIAASIAPYLSVL